LNGRACATPLAAVARDPKTGRVGGKVWWWVLLFAVLFAVWQAVPTIPGPSVRDFGDFVSSDRGEDFFRGAWCWWVVVVLAILQHRARRGAPLPGPAAAPNAGRLRKARLVANGVLFALYHLHQPWSIPNTFVDGPFLLAYPSRRFQSAWVGIIVHSVQSPFFIIIVLTKVLA
jgi:uncharacterized protein